jgi:hypothetical protein
VSRNDRGRGARFTALSAAGERRGVRRLVEPKGSPRRTPRSSEWRVGFSTPPPAPPRALGMASVRVTRPPRTLDCLGDRWSCALAVHARRRMRGSPVVAPFKARAGGARASVRASLPLAPRGSLRERFGEEREMQLNCDRAAAGRGPDAGRGVGCTGSRTRDGSIADGHEAPRGQGPRAGGHGSRVTATGHGSTATGHGLTANG